MRKNITSLADMRERYFKIIQNQVIKPATKELKENQKLLQRELKSAAKSTDRKMLEKGINTELTKVQKALDALSAGSERLKNMRLSGLPK